MTGDPPPGHAEELADRLGSRLGSPWEVYLERTRRFEVHLAGDRIEMRRGPIEMLGFGLRLLRRAGEQVGVGIAASSDFSPGSLGKAVRDAEETASRAPSPAKEVALPRGRASSVADLGIRDERLVADPPGVIAEYARELLAGVVDRSRVVPSFGSVRAAITDASMTNSEGATASFASTKVDLEFALKAFGGPEGRPPGEHWVTRRTRHVPRQGIAEEVRGWCGRAEDARAARPTEAGLTRVLFPAAVMADVLPSILGYRFSGQAAVRGMAPKPGDEVASPLISVTDDGRYPGSIVTAPWDDEGTPHGTLPLVVRGKFQGPMLDAVYAGALGGHPTGHGHRDSLLFELDDRFRVPVSPIPTTLVLATGDGGSDEELMEAAGDGIWLEQLGYAFPDGVTSAFGGEIRLGYRIRGGKKAEPIRGGTVGGFAMGPAETPPLLASVKALGSQGTLVGRLAAPTLLVEGFPIAGGP